MRESVLHLEFERIVGALENAADFSSDEKAHFENCSKCAVQLRKLQNLFSIAPTDFSETIPQAATANLLNIYQKPKVETPKNLINRLAGLLIFDDWQPEFALNERLSFQDSRQLLYRAEDYNIDLRLNFAEEKCVVSGQIFVEIIEKPAIVKIFNANFSLETSLNEYGEFEFPPLEQKNFDLQIVLDGKTIEIKDISY